MTEMSKPAEILYRAFHDELRFAKQQQWTITYYSVLLIGAGVGLARATLPMSCGRVVWFGLVALAMLTHSYLVFHLQRYMQTTRARQWRMEETFSPEDRRLARNEPPAERPMPVAPSSLSSSFCVPLWPLPGFSRVMPSGNCDAPPAVATSREGHRQPRSGRATGPRNAPPTRLRA